jgi:phosphoribosylaminoimidazolecarboxamide formyltransferase / IMP cyclohydrolase
MPRALLSVYDKTGIVDLAAALVHAGWDLISSGGTATAIANAGIEVTDVATLTGLQPILGHRVVTLHPAIHGGLLADLDEAEHREDMARHGIEPIALVVVNLYPFASNPSRRSHRRRPRSPQGRRPPRRAHGSSLRRAPSPVHRCR